MTNTTNNGVTPSTEEMLKDLYSPENSPKEEKPITEADKKRGNVAVIIGYIIMLIGFAMLLFNIYMGGVFHLLWYVIKESGKAFCVMVLGCVVMGVLGRKGSLMEIDEDSQ